MSVSTIFDAEEKRYIDIIITSEDPNEIAQAKSKLNNLTVLKWDSISNLGDMSDEIDSRLLAYKSTDDNQGVYKSTYQKWKEVLNKGIDSDSYEAARNLLVQSDRIIYSKLAKDRTDYLNKEKEKDSVIGVETNEEDTATLSGGTINTITRDENGIFHLVTTQKTVTLKEGSVLGGRVDVSKLEQDASLLDRRPMWTDTNVEYHRIKTEQGIVVDSAYLKRYYSVIDAEIYFGNEYVEDIHDIDWAVSQNTLPLYGYNSYTYDEVARGNRIISGQFTINFTSPNYLFSILAAANSSKVVSVENMASYSVPKLGDNIEKSYRSSAYGTREKGKHSVIWPETFDIDIIFGENTDAGDPVHIMLLGCAIQANQIVLSASATGSPPNIMERYSFIAQDIRTVVLQATGVLSSEIKDPTSTEIDTDDINDVEGSGNKAIIVNNNGNNFTNSNDTEHSEDDGGYGSAGLKTPAGVSFSDSSKDKTLRKDAVEESVYLKSKLSEDDENNNEDVDSSGDKVKVTYKQVSDPDTCELMARFSKIFKDVNNVLTSNQQKDLYIRMQICIEQNEYYEDYYDNGDKYYIFSYLVTYNGETKHCYTQVTEEIMNKLKLGTYYQKINK